MNAPPPPPPSCTGVFLTIRTMQRFSPEAWNQMDRAQCRQHRADVAAGIRVGNCERDHKFISSIYSVWETNAILMPVTVQLMPLALHCCCCCCCGNGGETCSDTRGGWPFFFFTVYLVNTFSRMFPRGWKQTTDHGFRGLNVSQSWFLCEIPLQVFMLRSGALALSEQTLRP